MSELLQVFPVDHAGRKKVLHPELCREIYAQTSVRYLRFPQPARVDRLELPVSYAGRWVPRVPTHPAHIVVSTLDRRENRWQPVSDVELPFNPKFAGEGLSQGMRIDDMEAFFEKAVAEQPAYRIELQGIDTDCLKVECDREHPVWPNHGECNGPPFNVPFGMLHPLQAFGMRGGDVTPPPYRRKLCKVEISPAAPSGMAVDLRNPLEVVFRGDKLTVGFSLVRPMLTRLDWNYFGNVRPAGNRLMFKRVVDSLGGLNGPSYITPGGNVTGQNMTGRVRIVGNRVEYRDIDADCGVKINAVFTVTGEAITVELEQTAERAVPVLEGEAWRFLWNMRNGLTSVAASPLEKEGRNGFVYLPALIAADTGGVLGVRLLEGDGLFHTESYRELEARSSSLVLAVPDTADAPLVIPEGTSRAVFELRPSALLPAVAAGREKTLSEGLRTCWTAGFSAFRPEFGGFSNNAISTNCHVNQHTAIDFAAFTARPTAGPDPLELVKFSVGRALLDGGGYGYHRNLYLDSDPILLSGAGRIVQLSGDRAWLERVTPGITAAARRVLDNFDAGEGMIVCRALSGNSGTFRWSSNAMDVIGFGHIDAYVNAWSFRGLKNAASLCALLGENELAVRCTQTAKALRDNYGRQLINPETGWVSGWRSRDGKLHDFGFIWINGVACAFGVMDDATSECALRNLEAKRG
ncbi:MAG: hypothetical protein K9N51_05845, partial [Candidatus Pacebacteria bacterium]|nr:hypothetical protein [Candidatus Paceibacterota bacterium]